MATNEWILHGPCEHFLEHVEGINALDGVGGIREA
jgi:hypothetical protein